MAYATISRGDTSETLGGRVSTTTRSDPKPAEEAQPCEIERGGTAAYFTGNRIFPGAEPIAQAYAGHQYGNLVRLGDGRAILLGEHITADGQRFDIQLKGSGPTPYSRRGDGRAALGPMLREYLTSEAMHALGIPTTRSLWWPARENQSFANNRSSVQS